MRFRFALAAVTCAFLAAGCSSASTTPEATGIEPAQSATRSAASFVITVPNKSGSASTAQRAPQYVSPATQSINVAISGPTTVSETQNLTIGSAGCTSTLAGLQCTLAVALQPCPNPPGDCYTATLTTYDQTNAGGSALSTAQSIAFTVASGAANAIPIALSGIPASTVVIPTTTRSTASGPNALDLYYGGTNSFVVESLDADGNIIAGSGAPLFTIGSLSGTPTGITAAPSITTQSAPNTFTVTLPTTGASGIASLVVAPTFSGQATDGCAATGANCAPVTLALNTLGPTGAFTFDPPSPLTLALDSSSHIAISEERYIGAFTVTGCTANSANTTCDPYPNNPTDFECHAQDMSGNYNSFSSFVSSTAPTLITADYVVGAAPATSCTLSIQDIYGNVGLYTIAAPAAPI